MIMKYIKIFIRIVEQIEKIIVFNFDFIMQNPSVHQKALMIRKSYLFAHNTLYASEISGSFFEQDLYSSANGNNIILKASGGGLSTKIGISLNRSKEQDERNLLYL